MTHSLLPDESLERLSAIASLALGGPSASGDGVRALVLSVPTPFPDEGIACVDVQAPRWSGQPWVLPENARSYLAVPLAGAADAAALELQAETDLVFCVCLPTAREWSPADIAAMRSIASTAAVELRLRSDASRLERATEEVRSFPLHDPLTELAHRELFLDRVGMTLLRSARYQDRHFAVLSLTIEQFAEIET